MFIKENRVPSPTRVNPETLIFILFIDQVMHYLSEAGVILFADDTFLFLAPFSHAVLYNKTRKAVSEFLTFSQQKP